MAQAEKKAEDDTTPGPENYIHRTLMNERGQNVGQIVDIEQYSLNRLLVVETPTGSSLLIPYHEELVMEHPTANDAPLIMRIPSELLEL